MSAARTARPARGGRPTHKPRWLASPEFQKVSWFEVEPPNLKDAYEERYWPAGLRAVLAQVAAQVRHAALPDREDGRIVSNEFGISAVGEHAWPISRNFWE